MTKAGLLHETLVQQPQFCCKKKQFPVFSNTENWRKIRV